MWCYSATTSANFYPRSPYGERQSYHQLTHHQSVFLSTLSLRRATRGGDLCYLDNIISIHALLTESDAWNRFTQRRDFISIHALLTESDLGNVEAALLMWNFYPRSPYGERRVTVLGIQHRTGISIHALLTESDLWVLMGGLSCDYFYPRSPYGERRLPTG